MRRYHPDRSPGPLPSLPEGVSAFTLIEVLVSMTILTIIMGSLYASYSSVHRALEQYDGLALKYHEARTALDIMRREIESAVISKGRRRSGIQAGSFILKDRDIFGKSASVLQMTSYSYRSGYPLRSVYSVKEQEGKLQLIKNENAAMPAAKAVSVTLIDNIEAFSVEVLFRKQWVKTWDTANTGKLPESVRISIMFDSAPGNADERVVKLTEYAVPMIGKKL